MTRSTFRTTYGQQLSAVTAQEMAEIDRITVDNVGLELLQMMENAGRILARHVRNIAEGDVLIVAGSGGNGGGGLTAARHLVNYGTSVDVLLDREPTALTGATTHQYRILDGMGIKPVVGSEGLDTLSPPSLLVDALLGYGVDGTVRDPARQLIEWMSRQQTPTVSLDVPSGIDATTGDALGVAVDPTRTVTLALPKTGLATVTGPLFLADIGSPHTVYEQLEIPYETPFGTSDWVELRGNQS